MAEFFKLSIADWNVGTDGLTLEQEAALLRVVNAILLYEKPIPHNLRVLGGLWRCNERKAKRLLAELVAAGKLTIEDGRIGNRRALNEASTLRRARLDARSTGRRGGLESGKLRRKALEYKEPPLPTLEPEKRREEKSSVDTDVSTGADAPPDPARVMFDAGVHLLGQSGFTEARARALIGKWRKQHGTESVIEALGRARREGAVDPVSFIEGALRFSRKARAERPPDIGDQRIRADGTVVEWSGAVGGWVEVRE